MIGAFSCWSSSQELHKFKSCVSHVLVFSLTRFGHWWLLLSSYLSTKSRFRSLHDRNATDRVPRCRNSCSWLKSIEKAQQSVEQTLLYLLSMMLSWVMFFWGVPQSDLERFSWCFASVVRVHRAFTGCGPFQ